MRIESYEALTAWDFTWPEGDGPWQLTPAGIAAAFADHAPVWGVYWIGYAPGGDHATFVAKYCGKALRQSIDRRLSQHVRRSTNRRIREHFASSAMLPPLWFRWVGFPSRKLIDVLEGCEIAAFAEDYWNLRNEWSQHWAMERDDIA